MGLAAGPTARRRRARSTRSPASPAQAATIETSLAGRKAWPGQGPTDPRIDQMTQTLLSAAALVRRYGAEIAHEQPDAHRDLEAARTRIMHGLYLTAHAVNVALHDNGRDRVNDARAAGRRVQLAQHHSPYAIAPTGVWVDRMAACENTARSYLTDRFTQALAGEVDPTRRRSRPTGTGAGQLGHPVPPRPGPRPRAGQHPAHHPHPGADRRREHGARRRGRHRRHPRAL